jgi:hypothetical protein
MTEEDLQKARFLCDHSSPGPWRISPSRTGVIGPMPECIWIASINNITPVLDVEFIAASRALIPRLLDEIEQMKPIYEAAQCWGWWNGKNLEAAEELLGLLRNKKL